jgi:glycosyltransferase involved in cell wall biosynthesis
MKNVCMLVQNVYDGDVRVRRKAEALVAAGYNVDVIALRAPAAHQKRYELNGVTVYTFSLGKMRGSLLRYGFEYFTFFILAMVKVSMLMRERQYVIIDVNTLPDFLIFAGWYCRRKGAKLVLDLHEITPEFFMSKYQVGERHWLVRLSRWIEKLSFDFADHVITINAPVQKLFESRGLATAKCTVIMNSMDESLTEKTKAASPSPNEFVMMYHGTLTRIYGLDVAIRALGMVHQQLPGARLRILGDGPERCALEKLADELGIRDKVDFIGRVKPEEVFGWLAQSHIGVLPTRSDVFLDYSFSNKLTEYVVMGKAVIVSRLRTIQYYFSGEALAYCEPENHVGLSKEMARMYNDPDLRSRLVAQAQREYVPIRWEVMKERYLELMAALASDNGDSSQTLMKKRFSVPEYSQRC